MNHRTGFSEKAYMPQACEAKRAGTKKAATEAKP